MDSRTDIPALEYATIREARVEPVGRWLGRALAYGICLAMPVLLTCLLALALLAVS